MALLFVSDNPRRSAETVQDLRAWAPLKPVELSYFRASEFRVNLPVIFDIDLSDNEAIKRFRETLGEHGARMKKVFITHGKSQAELIQASSLGAVLTISTLPRKIDAMKLLKLTADLRGTDREGTVPETIARSTRDVGALQDDLAQAVTSGEPLPKEQILNASDLVSESLKEGSIANWLEAVRKHNSYTYRHSLTTSGLAAAYARHLGFCDSDVRRVTVNALMHDVGKIKMPLSLLDKPGQLSPEERKEIEMHPVYGAEILRQDAQFNAEVVEVARHHHELLDGSGYPDGLSRSAISDPVRIMTIVDIFSALIDKRSYKEAMSAKEAYDVLVGMDGTVELVLVKAFEPVALAAQAANLDFVPENAVA